MLLTIITFIVVLGVLILIHELGHFVAAKLSGIKVEEFAIGFPPRIWSIKKGETEYSINILPIGGYVRLFGEDDVSGAEKLVSKIKGDYKRAFFAKSPLIRAVVTLAGVVMNFVLGWAIISFLFTQGVMVPSNNVYVEEVAQNSPAESAGLQPKDIIKQVEADSQVYDITTPKELIDTTNKYSGKEIILVIDRKGQIVDASITPRVESPEGEGAMGISISNYEEKVYSWTEAPFMGLKESFRLSRDLFLGIGQTFVKLAKLDKTAGEGVAGPLGIYQLTGKAVSFGSRAVLELMGLLSINLAILNLFPIPALDGGRLLFVVIEGLTGKKVDPKWEQQIHKIGLIILLALLLLATFNDALRFFR